MKETKAPIISTEAAILPPNDRQLNMEDIANIIQMKYEENLNVVETLFLEKKAMERRMQQLEAQLQQSQNQPYVTAQEDTIEISSPPPPSYGLFLIMFFRLNFSISSFLFRDIHK